MAGKGKTARAVGSATSPQTRAGAWLRSPAFERARFIVLVGAFAFLLVALVSYTPPGRGNLCGEAGRAAAGLLVGWLGFSVFLLLGLLLFWGAAVLFGRPLERPLVKALGIVLVTLSLAVFLARVVPAAPYRGEGLHGPGGLAGVVLLQALLAVTGDVGTLILATTGILVGLVLGTDWLAFDMARDGVKVLRSGAAAAPRLGRALIGLLPGRRPPRIVPVLTEPESPTRTRDRRSPGPLPVGAPPRENRSPLSDRARPEPSPLPPGAGAERRPVPPSKKTPRSRETGDTADGPYTFPPLDLLDPVKTRDSRSRETMIKENAEILEETLADFRVEAEVVDYCRGPVVTLYELDLAPGVKVTRIHNLAEDLAVALKAPSVRVVAPLPGKSTIGVEVPNPVRDDVRLLPLLDCEAFLRNPGFLPICLGKDVSGSPIIEDLSTMPHLLVAGATGTGKSVCINAILLSLLMTRTPEEVRLILIDPKQVELAFFAKVPHLMSPVVTEAKRALAVLEWLVHRMEARYGIFHDMEVRNIHAYNDLGRRKIRKRKEEMGITEEDEEAGSAYPDRMPYIVVVVDELADLMMVAGKDIESLITRLAQKSRAVGIHIVLATQRPSTDVITGLIKANMPTRISFQVASKIDSRVVLDQNGAEKLLGRGDLLYLPPRTSHLVRAQGTFVSDGEVKRAVAFLSGRIEQQFDEGLTRATTGEMLRDEEKDPLYEEAVEIVLSEQRGSASLLQRALGVGYTRGSRLMDMMHKEGFVGPYKGSKAREVLMTLEEYQALRRDRQEG